MAYTYYPATASAIISWSGKLLQTLHTWLCLYQQTTSSTNWKNAPFCWTGECDNAFNRLRQLFISAPIRSYPNFSTEFILDMDESNDGAGAVLSQRHNSMEHVVAYASKSLTKAERN